MRTLPRRRGVAAVVGTVIFVLVFMAALGSMAYASNLQQQAAAAQQQAQQVASRRMAEGVAFSLGPSGLVATDTGRNSLVVNHVILKFPNGTVYSLASAAVIPAGGSAMVKGLIPGGVCSPGTATCLSLYGQIVAGTPEGSSVGIVTSMGNSFWYTHSSGQVGWASLTGFPKPCPAGEAVTGINTSLACAPVGFLSSWVKVPVLANGPDDYTSTTLAISLSANSSYAFYVFAAVEPSLGIESYNFEVHALPAGATLVIACSPMSYPFGGGNQPTNCVRSPGTPIAAGGSLEFGVLPPVYATPGLFGVVSLGAAGGRLQIDFACTANCGGIVLQPGSFMLAQAVG